MNDNKQSRLRFLKSTYKIIVPLKLRIIIRGTRDRLESVLDLHIARFIYSPSIRRIFRSIFKTKTILFYPHLPQGEYFAIYKICRILGYNMSGNPNKHFDLVINWEDCTWRTSDKTLSHLANQYECLNIRCKDISKKYVQSLFEEVFGYPSP